MDSRTALYRGTLLAIFVVLLLLGALVPRPSIGSGAESTITPTTYSYLPFVVRNFPPTPGPELPPPEKEAWASATFARAWLGSEKAAWLCGDWSRGYVLAEAFKNRATELGLDITAELYAPLDTCDFTPYLNQVIESGADLVYTCAWSSAGYALIRDQGWWSGLFPSAHSIADSWAFTEYYSTYASSIEGAYVASVDYYPTIYFYVVSNEQFEYVTSIP